MRASASLVVIGLGLVAFQVAFSNGAVPRIAPLPIGIVPVAVGSLALLAGMVLGLAVDDARYRTASLAAWLGSACIFFAIIFVTTGGPGRRPALTINEIALLAGAVMWLVALVLGASAILRSRSPGETEGL